MGKKTREKRKYDHQLTVHHRKPTSIGGERQANRNKSDVPRIQHQSWHNLFSNHSAPTICAIINEKWLDPDYKFICVPADKEALVLKYIKQLT
jgi:hypothetical protein